MQSPQNRSGDHAKNKDGIWRRAEAAINGFLRRIFLPIAPVLAPHPVRILQDQVTKFGRHEGGSILILFGLAVVPLCVFVGYALDYSYASQTRTQLNAAADAAALSTVGYEGITASPTQAKTTAQNYFNAASNVPRTNITNVSINVTDGVTGARTTVVSYTASVQTAFLGVINVNNITVNGSVTATATLPIYMDFYLLLDNTPSMGVGATPTDVSTMVSNTSDQCAFACHDLSNPNNYYNLAKSLGVTMRIDTLRTATQQLMDTAKSTEAYSNQFRMAIYTFGAAAETAGLTAVSALSTDLTTAKSNAAAIDLMTVPYQNYNNDMDTNYNNVLAAMNTAIPNPGDGSSSSSPQKVLFFVSDGVADETNPGNCSQSLANGGTRCQEPIDVSLCTAIKNRGITIAVLYTTYLALPTNNWYMQWINGFNAGPYNPSINSKIAQNMQSCASTGYYFEVTPTQGISAAMTALFQKVVGAARLSH